MTEAELATAQKLIRDLRAELYSTRNAQKEAKQQAESLRSELASANSDLERERQQTAALRSSEAALAQAKTSFAEIEIEIRRLKETASRLAMELEEEKTKRQRAQEARDRIEADRLRLQRSRDETARNLMAAQRRVQELEEEQSRAEQDHQAEISSLQSRLEGGMSPKTPANGHSEGDTDFRQEAEMERQRGEGLLVALNAAKRERDAAVVSLQQLQQSHRPAEDESQGAVDKATGRSAPETTAEVQEAAARIQALQHRVVQLSAVREKLMQELDLQVEETDRVAAENTALTQAMLNARKLSNAWEAQTNDSLVQIDRLKDLLEESATWQSPGESDRHTGDEALQNPQASTQSVQAENGTKTANASPSEPGSIITQLEKQLMQERATAAELDLHLRAMVAEVSRTSSVASDLRNFSLPALTGVEAQLKRILHMTATNVTAHAGSAS